MRAEDRPNDAAPLLGFSPGWFSGAIAAHDESRATTHSCPANGVWIDPCDESAHDVTSSILVAARLGSDTV